MSRLNDQLRPRNIQKSEANRYLSTIINKMFTSYDTNPEVRYYKKELNQIAKDFFENFYIKIDKKGELNYHEGVRINTTLSTSEAFLLNYMMSPRPPTHACVLLGHAGVGKSTLLKYLLHYLYFVELDIADQFLPAYIALSDDTGKVKSFDFSDQLYSYLDEQLFQTTHESIYNYLINIPDVDSFLDWVNTNSYNNKFCGEFTSTNILDIKAKGIAEYIRHLDGNDRKAFLLEAMRYYTKYYKRIVIVIDNIDRFSKDIHHLCLSYADKKLNQYFNCILAMRQSTYKQLDSNISEKMDLISPSLSLSIDTVKIILKKRIEESKNIILTSAFSLSVSPEQLVEGFISLLSHEESLNALVFLSNQNMHLLMRKLRIITESDYFNDDLVKKELMRSILSREEHRIQLWILYSLLFGNYCGTFKSNDEMMLAGIINLFYNDLSVYKPYYFFSCLHILSRLYVEEGNDEAYFSVKKISGEYYELFKDDIHFSENFNTTMYHLIRSGLIFSKSCFRYTELQHIENRILDDAVIISDAGRYYLTGLIRKIEYLYFMKDDINWFKKTNFNMAELQTPRLKKFINTLLALIELMRIELDMLRSIRNKSNDEGKNFTNKYMANFSALRLSTNNTVIFTKAMWLDMLQYINWILDSIGDGETRERDTKDIVKLKQLIKDVQQILEENNELEKAFLQS